LSIEPAAILLGQSAELTWNAAGSTSCEASGGWTGDLPTSGSRTVTPDATGEVTYTLRCEGGDYGGGASGAATLEITAARLAELQSAVFTPRCTSCHDGSQPAGGALPGSMDLRVGASHTSLVGVASLEQGAVMRVAPGDPAASYLVRKLEGAAGITGQRMPLGGPFLDAETIARVRSWIADGAEDN
jgi:hypothetical protein